MNSSWKNTPTPVKGVEFKSKLYLICIVGQTNSNVVFCKYIKAKQHNKRNTVI